MTKDGYIMEKNVRTPMSSGSILLGKNMKYVVQEVIGEGSTSIVYRGIDSSGIIVIIKELYPLLGEKIIRDGNNCLCVNGEIREIFNQLCQREKEVYEFSKSLLNAGRETNDPHGWTYVDSFEVHNTYYQICQNISGKSLDKAIVEGMIKLEKLEDYLDIGLHIIPAVRSLHKKKLIHADLKPQNIFVVDSKPNVFYRCIDFGSAVNEGNPCIISTTPDYSPAEIQFDYKGNIANAGVGRTGVQYDYDTYSILAIVYKLLTGTSPKAREDKNADMFTRGSSNLFNISDEALRYLNIVFKNGLSNNKELRFKSLDSLEKALVKLKVMLEKKIYIESVSCRNISPNLKLVDTYEEIFRLAIEEDKSISFFKIEKERDAFFACAQFFAYCRRKKNNYKIIPITYRNGSLKDTLCALPFGFSEIMPYDESKILEVKNLGAEYCVVVLGYQYSEKDKGILESLKGNKGVRFWFFGDSKFDGKYYSLPSDDDYAISTTRNGVLKYFEVVGNYGISKQILEKLDDADLGEVEGLCQNGTLWRFGNKIYCSPEVFPFVCAEDEEDEDGATRRNTIVKLLGAIINCAEDEEYKALNQYQSLSVSDFQLSMFLLKKLPCDKQLSVLLSKLYSCCDKESFRRYLLDEYEQIFKRFLREEISDVSDNVYILGRNFIEFFRLISRAGDRELELMKYAYILYQLSKYPRYVLQSSMDGKNYDQVIDAATMLIDLFSCCGDSYKHYVDEYYEMRAKAYFKKGDYAKAEDDYTELIENREKKTFEIYTNRANTYAKMQKNKEAEQDYTTAIEVNPNSVVSWNERGKFYYEISCFVEAEEDLKRAIELNDRIAGLYSNLSGIQMKLKKWNEAKKSINKALELNSKSAWSWNRKGMLHSELLQYEEAEQCYEKAYEIDSLNFTYLSNLSSAKMHLGKWNEAIEAINRALEINPKYATGWNQKGALYSELSKYEEAEQYYKRACEYDLYEALYYSNLANIQIKLKKWNEAEASINRALELNPKFPGAWNEKSRLLLCLEKYEEAEDCCEKTCELEPRNDAYFTNLFLVQYNLGKWSEAEHTIKKALQLKPNAYWIWRYFADLWFTRSDKDVEEKYAEAEIGYKRAVDLKCKKEDVFYRLGQAQLGLHKFFESYKNFSKAIELNSDYAPAWNGLGQLYEDQGDLKNALKYYERALQLDPTNETYKEDIILVKEELDQR